jgi:hypothetical protein
MWPEKARCNGNKGARENHMKLQNKGLILTAVLAGLMLPAAAQTNAVAPPPGTIHARKENQQDRIAQGVKSGQLTAGETAHLEKREARINKEVHHERVANGGKLTPAERRQVNRQQNRTSRAIYRDKHNARVQ